MKTYVINLKEDTERWTKMQQHLATFGIEPIRWEALGPDGIDVPDWRGAPVSDPERRVAILRTYRALFEHLYATGEQEWLILQDDVELDRDPHRDSDAIIYLYTGYVLRRAETVNGVLRPIEPPSIRVVDPLTYHHVCPKAFRIRREAIPRLYTAWADETRQACESWTPYLTARHVEYDHVQPPAPKRVTFARAKDAALRALRVVTPRVAHAAIGIRNFSIEYSFEGTMLRGYGPAVGIQGPEAPELIVLPNKCQDEGATG